MNLKKLEIKSQIQIYLLPSCTVCNRWQRFPQNALLTLFWQLISASSPFKPRLNSVNLPIFVHENVTSLLHYTFLKMPQVNEASISSDIGPISLCNMINPELEVWNQYALYKCSKFWVIPPNLQSPIPEPEGQKQGKGGHRCFDGSAFHWICMFLAIENTALTSPKSRNASTVLWVSTIWNSVIASGKQGAVVCSFLQSQVVTKLSYRWTPLIEHKSRFLQSFRSQSCCFNFFGFYPKCFSRLFGLNLYWVLWWYLCSVVVEEAQQSGHAELGTWEHLKCLESFGWSCAAFFLCHLPQPSWSS